MSKRKTFAILAAIAFCVWPALAAAQQQDDDGFVLEEAPEKEPIVITTSSVELGAGWVTDDSFKFGEYSGHQTDGPFGIGNVLIYRRSSYDGASTSYWTLTGRNLGLESRSVRGEYGRQGQFRLFLDYDQLPHYRFNDGETPFLNSGGTNLMLPGGWTPATDAPAFFPTNDRFLNRIEIKTERQKYGGGFSWNIAKQWEFSGSYHREDKEGTETIAGIFGTSGGNMRSSIFAKPIDYTTNQGDLKLQYGGERLQGQLSYTGSFLNNKQPSLVFSNPYTAQAAWDDSQDFANGGQGRLALEPDNSAHNIALSGAYTIGPTTQVTGSFAYGRMFQNDSFLPYTINPALTAADGVSSPLAPPRDSLEGDVTTLHGGLSFVTRPTVKSRFKAKYTFDDRDNNTPREVFLTIPNDTGDDAGDQAALNEARARINRTYSRTKHKVNLDGSYRVLPKTKLTVGYDFEAIARDLTEVDDTFEHTGRIKLRATPSLYANGWLQYAYSTRDGSNYKSNEPFLASHTPEYLATLAPEDFFEQNPFLRKFYIADRRRHKVTGAINVMPHEQVTLGLSGSVSRSDFPNSLFGLTDMNYTSATFDASFMPRKDLTISAFFTYENMEFEQAGYERGSASITPSTVLNPILFWKVRSRDHAYSAGTEVQWTAIENKLDIVFDYTYSKTVTRFEFDADPSRGVLPLPTLRTDLHSVGVRGDYRVTKDLILRLGYRYEHFNTDDFALDGINEGIPRVMGLGNQSPKYGVHVIGVSVVWPF